MELLIVIIAVIVISFGLMLRNQLKNYEKLQDYNEYLEGYVSELETLLFEFKSRVMENHSRIKQIDKLGSFESDDEVGFFFKELKGISESISKFFDAATILDDDNSNGEIESAKR